MSVFDPVILSQLQLLAKAMADTTAAISAAIANVDGDVAVVGGQVTGVGTQVTTVDNKVVTVSGQVNAVSNALATLQATANTINNTANVINAKNTGIKSVQRGVLVLNDPQATGTVAITAVNPAKSELRFLGCTPYVNPMAISLEGGTAIRGTRAYATQYGSTTGHWELTEWN